MNVYFYHLVSQPLERALPELLEKCLSRGWKAAVEVSSDTRRDALDNHLWVYREDSFLPHSAAQDDSAGDQPIWLTANQENANEAHVRFMLDGTSFSKEQSGANYERVCYMFDGNDEEAVLHARGRWKAEKEAGHEVTYWRQAANGRWEQKA